MRRGPHERRHLRSRGQFLPVPQRYLDDTLVSLYSLAHGSHPSALGPVVADGWNFMQRHNSCYKLKHSSASIHLEIRRGSLLWVSWPYALGELDRACEIS